MAVIENNLNPPSLEGFLLHNNQMLKNVKIFDRDGGLYYFYIVNNKHTHNDTKPKNQANPDA